jgi:hypothetical protein
MTQQEKHALIAKKLMGYTQIDGLTGDVFPYSDDLELCREAELSIPDLGDEPAAMYHDILGAACPAGVPEWWWRMTAPASARVDAMCALIAQLEAA